jgi:hypothetical protein
LTLRAERVPLAEVLRAIGAAGAFEVVLRGELAELVTQSFTNQPLEGAIRQLVGAHFLVVHHDRPADQAGTSLAEIRATASRTQASIDTAGTELDLARPNPVPEAEAADPIDRQEVYRQAMLDYAPPTKDGLLLELDEMQEATRVAAVPKVGALPPSEAIEVITHVFAPGPKHCPP